MSAPRRVFGDCSSADDAASSLQLSARGPSPARQRPQPSAGGRAASARRSLALNSQAREREPSSCATPAVEATPLCGRRGETVLRRDELPVQLSLLNSISNGSPALPLCVRTPTPRRRAAPPRPASAASPPPPPRGPPPPAAPPPAAPAPRPAGPPTPPPPATAPRFPTAPESSTRLWGRFCARRGGSRRRG